MLLISKSKDELQRVVADAKSGLLTLVVYTNKPYKVSAKLLKPEILSSFDKAKYLYVVEYEETRHGITLKQHHKNCEKILKEIKEL